MMMNILPYLTSLTLCGLECYGIHYGIRPIIQWSWGLSGLVHEKAHPCLSHFVKSLRQGLTLGATGASTYGRRFPPELGQVHSHSSLSLPSLSPTSSAPFSLCLPFSTSIPNPLPSTRLPPQFSYRVWGLEEHYKLPHRGPGRQRICIYFRLRNRRWWWWFSVVVKWDKC